MFAPMGRTINAVRRSSWRALPALHKPPQGGFFTTAQPFFTASISEPKKGFYGSSCKLKPNLTVTRFTGSHLLPIGTSGFARRRLAEDGNHSN